MTTPKIVVFQGKDGWRFRIVARNHRIVAVGEAHPTKRGAIRAAQSIGRIAWEIPPTQKVEVEL